MTCVYHESCLTEQQHGLGMSDDPEHPDIHRPQVAASGPRDMHAHTADPSSPPLHPANAAEFVAFYMQAIPRLVAFLRWQGASLPDAAECAQEALTQALPPRWSTIDHPHAWCRRVASRLYARRVATLEEPVEDAEAAGSPLLAPGTDLDAFEQRHSVLRLLDRLPSRQRQVMAWTYDGATPSEIAAELQITPEAVRSNLKKARAALRNHLQENGGEIG